jgi:uncharacterized membrane protein
MDQPPSHGEQDRPGNHVLYENIALLRDVRKRYERERSRQQRLADAITAFAGSMRSVYLHGLLFGSWLLLNSGLLSEALVFDPYPFVMLAMFASVEAIFLSTFVLMSQNRQAELSTRRDELELQINLLAEHEVTQLITLVDDIAQHLGVPRRISETEPLKEKVAPDRVLSEIERTEHTSARE